MMESYTLRDIEAMLGISRSVIDGLIGAGFVSPTRGKKREYRFTFQDLVILRTALDLRAANIPPRKISRSLKRLRESLPEELPMSGCASPPSGVKLPSRTATLSGKWIRDNYFSISKSPR
jgi:hypothetical protein